MAVTFTVSLANIINELSLETLYMPGSPDEVLISSRDVSRPGLELTGFFDYYDNTRILIIGNTEHAFLSRFSKEERCDVLSQLMSRKPPAIIISRSLEPSQELLATAKENEVPILRTADATSSLVAALVSYMNVELAPRITRHGVLVEVYGEGLLLVGDSGVGKSETAIELIKRGHRLIADDAVKSAGYPKNPWWALRRKTSATLSNCGASASLMRAGFSEWARSNLPKRSIW